MNITSIGEILFDIYPNHKRLGGAPLNFIHHVQKLTGTGNIISRVGRDVLGTKAIAEIETSGINTHYIQTDKINPTGVANVTIDDDGVPNFLIEPERAFDFIEIDENAEELINTDTECLYFGTLAQRSPISRKSIQSLFDKGLKYFCDLNLRMNFYDEGVIESSLGSADFLKVSYDEMKVVNSILLQSEYNTEKVAFELMDQYNIQLIAVTRGKDGATLFENGKRNDYSSVDLKVVDTTGAGDAFSAVLCVGFLQGLELPLINKLSNDFASEICKFTGAIPRTDRIYDTFRELLGFF